MWSIRAGHHRLVRGGDAREGLYDFTRDTSEPRAWSAETAAGLFRHRPGPRPDSISPRDRNSNQGMLPAKEPTP